MKTSITCFLTLFVLLGIKAQTTTTFESLNLPPGSFLDGSDGSGGFSDGNVFLPNTYDNDYAFWSGWAISSTTDTLTPGYTNQYSAVTGSGYDGSLTYSVTYASPGSNLILTGDAQGGTVEGVYVTNSTYAYLSMLNGDSFAKKFGGETGDDPDFFLLTIKKYLNGELSTDSIDFYLADFRFEDNSQDYFIKDWTYLELSDLGDADSLQFSLSSSDVGQYGINTPAYFCLDQLTTLDRPTAAKNYLSELEIKVFPNPTSHRVTVNWQEPERGSISLFNAGGQLVRHQALLAGDNSIAMENLPAGNYFLKVETPNGRLSRKLVKTN